MPLGKRNPLVWALAYVVIGILFGFALIKGEMASWYRIQEMFRFQSFHMYGLMFSAVGVSFLVISVVRRRATALSGDPMDIAAKPLGRGVRYAAGGLVFGLGWGLGGVCPGPVYALMGSAIPGAFLVFAAALAGTWVYGKLEPKLPH